MPDERTHGRIIRLPNLTCCSNWRGITLLSIPSKMFSKIIMTRLKAIVDKLLRPEQTGFRKGRGTTEHIFTLRNILEQCNEWQRQIYVNVVDFDKSVRQRAQGEPLQNEALWNSRKAGETHPDLLLLKLNRLANYNMDSWPHVGK